MKMDIVLLGKNFYDMNGQQGANVVVLGSYEDTSNKTGLSVSEANIPYSEHFELKYFPAIYSADGELVSVKNRSGKSVTSLKLSNLKLKSKLELKEVIENGK